jgi:regulator of sigma E protease
MGEIGQEMSAFLVAACSFSVMICLLIFLHEWGHFAAARLFGVRVDVFSIGFGSRLLSWKRGATDYRLSALPFGGYVKMAGDNPLKPRSGAADEFLSKPRWQRTVIALAGPAMNVLATFLLFWASFALVGLPYPAYLTRAANVAAVAEGAETSEIHPGDVITEVNGVNTPSWDAVFAQSMEAAPGSEINLVVMRNGASTPVKVKKPEGARDSSYGYLGYPLVQPRVDSVASDTPAAQAGLKAGDLVASVNGDPLVTWPQFVDMLRESRGPYPVILVLRGHRSVPLHFRESAGSAPDGQDIGATPKVKQVYHRQGLVLSARGAAFMTVLCAKQIGDVFRGLFSGSISIRELQGVVGIAQESGQAASHGPSEFIDLIALISLNLGLLNLLPIPVLDGGHILLLAIEGTFQRDMNLVVKQRFVQASLVFLLALSAVAMFSDIQRLIQSLSG